MLRAAGYRNHGRRDCGSERRELTGVPPPCLSLHLVSGSFYFYLIVNPSPSLFLLPLKQKYFGKDKSSEFQLFSSPHGKDLLFTNAAHGFLRVPPKVDAKLYLGYEYLSAIQHLKRGM